MTKANDIESGVTCPFCGGHGASVTDSRPRKYCGETVIHRSRPCGDCGRKFHTKEISVQFLEDMERKIRRDMADKIMSGFLK